MLQIFMALLRCLMINAAIQVVSHRLPIDQNIYGLEWPAAGHSSSENPNTISRNLLTVPACLEELRVRNLHLRSEPHGSVSLAVGKHSITAIIKRLPACAVQSHILFVSGKEDADVLGAPTADGIQASSFRIEAVGLRCKIKLKHISSVDRKCSI